MANEFARKLRKEMTNSERLLWSKPRNRQAHADDFTVGIGRGADPIGGVQGRVRHAEGMLAHDALEREDRVAPHWRTPSLR